MNTVHLAVGALCLALVAGSAQPAVLWAFDETGGDVVGSFSGSLDLTGATPAGLSNVSMPQMTPSIATIFTGADFTLEVDLYEITGPADFGSGGTTPASSVSGVPFVIGGQQGLVGVFEGYVSGNPIGGAITFQNATFASLGIDPGEYVYSLPNDTVTLRFGPAAVIPLPATLPLLAGALVLTGAAVRRRA